MSGGKLTRHKPTSDQVDRVVRWVLAGATEAEILAAIDKEWPEANTKALIAAAFALFREAGDFDGQAVLGFCYEATREVYRQALKEKNWALALKAVKQMSDIAEKRL